MNMLKVDRSLAVVAMLAALANYEGLSLAMRAETLWQRGFCAAIAFGVFTTISVFWHIVFSVVPGMQAWRSRVGVWLTTIFGVMGILGISAWWSVSALGGPAAMQAVYEGVVAQAEQAVAASRASSGQFQKLEPGLEALNADLGTMTKCESKKGCITSGGGAGGVSSLLGQLRDRANGILSAAHDSKTRLDDMSGKATTCLAAMRQALSMPSMTEREDELARQVDCFNGALGDIGNVAGGAGIAQALDTFTSGIVVPVAVKSDKQKAAADEVLAGLKERTASLARSAQATISAAPFTPVAMVRVNAMQAVISQYKTVIPAWATGICLDIAPLALLLLLTQKLAADRTMPDESHLERPIKDILIMRRAVAELEPWPSQPPPPQLPQRRPGPRGMQG